MAIPASKFYRLCNNCGGRRYLHAHLTWLGRTYFRLPQSAQVRLKRFIQK